jgi:hypothetical protein
MPDDVFKNNKLNSAWTHSTFSKVIAIEIIPAGPDSFGEILGGLLHISFDILARGIFKQIFPRIYNGYYILCNTHKPEILVHFDRKIYNNVEIYIIPMRSDGRTRGRSVIMGLLLKTTNSRKGEYERIGYWSTYTSPRVDWTGFCED